MDRDFVLVHRSLFDPLRQHCEHCRYFDGQLEGSVDGQVVKISSRRHGPASSDRNPSRGSGRSQRKICGTRLRPADAALTWFLRNAPKATTCRTRQIELGLQTAEQYEKVIRAFGHVADIRGEASHVITSSGDQFVDLAERLALQISNSLANANLLRSAALFQTLVLLSYCEVLKKRGAAFETIDRIIGHIAAAESARRKILTGALWINGVINKLVDGGWTIYRATELFFISAFPKPLS